MWRKRLLVKKYSIKTVEKLNFITKPFSHRALNVFIITVFLFNISGFLIVKVITEHQQRQQRTPHVLNSEQELSIFPLLIV